LIFGSYLIGKNAGKLFLSGATLRKFSRIMFGGVFKLTVSYFRNSKSLNLTLLYALETKLLCDDYNSNSFSVSLLRSFYVLEPIYEELF